MAENIILHLECRNCNAKYDWEPYYATFSNPVDDFDVTEPDPNAANRAPSCPSCKSWAVRILGQDGG